MLWSSYYATGNELVDSEHQEIFGMVDRLLMDDFEGRPDKIKTVVGFLVDYVLNHFDHEEALMKESKYPKMAEHMKIHRDFVETVSVFARKVKGDTDSMSLSTQVNEIIVDWLADHVMKNDKTMINHYKEWSLNKNETH